MVVYLLGGAVVADASACGAIGAIGVIAEVGTEVFLVDVVVLLIGNVDARDDCDYLRNFEDIQLILFLLDIEEELFVVNAGLVSLVERGGLVQLHLQFILPLTHEFALPKLLETQSERFIFEHNHKDKDKLR